MPLTHHKTLLTKMPCVFPGDYHVSNFVNTAPSQPHPKRIPCVFHHSACISRAYHMHSPRMLYASSLLRPHRFDTYYTLITCIAMHGWHTFHTYSCMPHSIPCVFYTHSMHSARMLHPCRLPVACITMHRPCAVLHAYFFQRAPACALPPSLHSAPQYSLLSQDINDPTPILNLKLCPQTSVSLTQPPSSPR